MTASAPGGGCVALAPRAEDNGLASMIATMLRQNLDDHPEKVRDLERLQGRVALVAEDAGVALTMVFSGGRVDLHDGIVGIPDVTVRGPSEDIMAMSLVELDARFRLPDPRGEATKRMLDASTSGRVRVFGALGNLPLLVRLTRIMSVA